MALTSHPTSAAGRELALVPLAEALIASDHDERARGVLAEALHRAPAAPAILNLLALLDRRRGDLAGAAARYEEVARIEPADMDARRLAAVLRSSGTAVDAPPTLEPGLRGAPVVSLPGFLPDHRTAELRALVERHRDEFALGGFGNEDVPRPDVRSNLWLNRSDVHRALAGRFREAFRAVLPSVVMQLGLEPFAPGSIEIKLCAYPGGTFFRVHRDRPAPHAPDFAERLARTRQVSFVCFVHAEPRRFTGGDLLVHDTDVAADVFWTHRYTRVVPTPGLLACFPSGFYHQVTEVHEDSGDLPAGRLSVSGHGHEIEQRP